MEKELQRAKAELGKSTAAYFISYTVYDEQVAMAVGINGSLVTSTTDRKRTADVIMRVGTPALDNAHGENRPSAISTDTLPLDDDAGAISHALWRLTFSEYRQVSNAFLNVQTKSQVNAKEDDLSADFSKETAQTYADYQEVAPVPEQKAMESFVRRFSAAFAKYPYIYSSGVMVSGEKSLQRFVSSEDGRVVMPDTVIRVVIQAETRAEDGMELVRMETLQADSMDKFPAAAEIDEGGQMAKDRKALREAPVAEPYDGPALLSGRAAPGRSSTRCWAQTGRGSGSAATKQRRRLLPRVEPGRLWSSSWPMIRALRRCRWPDGTRSTTKAFRQPGSR